MTTGHRTPLESEYGNIVSQKMSISVKDAVKIAHTAFREMFPDVKDIRLEEVEMDDDGPWWNITFSYAEPINSSTSLASLVGKPDRTYKLVKLHRVDGEMHSIKIRKL